MTRADDPSDRLQALGRQLQEVHDGLLDDLDAVRRNLTADAVADSGTGMGTGIAAGEPARRLAAHCAAFCSALGRHHAGEDAAAFPVLAKEFPALRSTIDKLEQDHHLIADILSAVDELLASDARGTSVLAELDGLAAIMQSHFTFEEKALTAALNSVEPASVDAAEWFGTPGR